MSAATIDFRYLKQNLSKIKWATAASALTVPAYFTENVEVSSAMNYSSLVAESLKEVPSTNKKRPLNKKLDLDLEIDDESDSYYSSVTKNGRDDGVEEQTKKSKGAHEHTEVVKVPCLISADHLRVHEYFFPNVADRIVEIDDIDDVLPSPPSSTEISHSGHPHQVNNNFLSTALSAQLKASSNSLKHSLKIEAESEVSTDGNDGKHSTVVGFQPTTVDSSETISLAINTISTVHVGSTFEPDEILHNSPTESTSPATLVLDNNVMGGDGSTGYHLDNLDAVNKEIRDKNSGIKCPDVVTPLRAQTLPSCVNQPSSTDQKSYTALCDYPLGIVRTKQIEQNMPSTYAYYFKTSILDVKSVILGLVKDVLALHHLLLHEGTGKNILPPLSYNILCMFISLTIPQTT